MPLEAQFQFTTNNGTITITAYNGTGGAVSIPSQTNGYPVTSIGFQAFAQSPSHVTSVTIPDSVTNAGGDRRSGGIPENSILSGVGALIFYCQATATFVAK